MQGRRLLLPALLLPLLCQAAPARAQLSLSAALESDYRFRGLSLSNGRPSLGLSVAYDHPSGAYAGASVIGQDTAHDGARLLGYMEYAGYAFHTGSGGPTFDVGADNENFSQYSGKAYAYSGKPQDLHYSEVYGGVSWRGFSSHLYYSPDYFKAGASTLYADIDGVWRPNDDWRLFAHAGALSPLAGGGGRERYDLRFGVARAFRNSEAHVAWSGYFPGPSTSTVSTRPGVVVGLSVFF